MTEPADNELRPLTSAAGDVTLGKAADAYLATLRGAEHSSTRRIYGRILRWIVTEFGSDAAPDIDPEQFAAIPPPSSAS